MYRGFCKRHPREYSSWTAMKNRVTQKSHKYYNNYGGRGIKICDRWLGKDGFKNFYEDMGERQEGMTLDRIDVDGDYCPENCRWATLLAQERNKRTAKIVSYNGESLTISEWSKKLGINQSTLYMRFRVGGLRGDDLFFAGDYRVKGNR